MKMDGRDYKTKQKILVRLAYCSVISRPQTPTDSDFILSEDLLKTMESPESMDDHE